MKEIAYFAQDLITHLGDDARRNFNLVGLSNTDIRQFEVDGGMKSLIAIEDTFDESRATTILSVEEANQMLADNYAPTYNITSDALMSITLNAKIANGSIDITQLPAGDQQAELAWLHGQGVSGIGVSAPPKPFAQ